MQLIAIALQADTAIHSVIEKNRSRVADVPPQDLST